VLWRRLAANLGHGFLTANVRDERLDSGYLGKSSRLKG
jgi:hypothetical protein